MFNGYSHQYKHLFTRDLFEIYFLLTFRALGFSLVGIFLPLYLLFELSFSFPTVILFFLITSFAFAVGNCLALPLISRFGAKHAMVWSYGFLLLGFFLLYFLERYHPLFVYIALLQGFSMGLFWIGFHVDVALHSRKKTLGKETGILSLLSILGAVIGPLLGALVLKFFSFSVLFLFAIAFLLLSVLPLLFSRDVFVKTHFDLRSFFVKEHVKYFFGYFAQGVRASVGGIFWPIFIFSLFGSYLVLGWYGSLATLVMGVLSYIVGNLSDRWKSGLFIRFSAPFEALFWFLRLFVQTVGQIFVVGFLGGIASIGIDVPLLAKTYGRAKKEEVAAFLFFRELAIRCGEVFVLLFVLFIGTVESSFIISALVSLFYLFF